MARNASRDIEVENKILPEFLIGAQTVFADDIAQRGQAVIMHGVDPSNDIRPLRRGAGRANVVAP